ncbi:mitochondrial 37S ribosomal protein rsm10 [Dimargaris verticillata]|uniref:Small ribosomal subunit protein uS10m n=1 Tax=Dimargaris verticillata TaxID=2761393 RepID=A0A9W8B4X2_9FUNG|nr:mitochondrial 37S ribosomal protein rsm10 [Dimargaris verticillata]
MASQGSRLLTGRASSAGRQLLQKPQSSSMVFLSGVRAQSTTSRPIMEAMDRVLRLNKFQPAKTSAAVKIDPMWRPAKKVPPTMGLTTCNLHFEAFSNHRIDFYINFVRKVAEVMKVPCSNVVGLPTHTHVWTVLKSPFVHKGAQENFSRLRIKRLLQIKDTHPDTLKVFLNYIEDNLPAGVGMRIHRFEYATLNDALTEAERVKPPKGEPLSSHHVKAIADAVIDHMKSHPTDSIDKVAREAIKKIRPDAMPPPLMPRGWNPSTQKKEQ